jgi:hypothetical protein
MLSLVQRTLVVTRRYVAASSTNVPWILTALLFLISAAVSALLVDRNSVRYVLHSERDSMYPLGSSAFQFQVSNHYNS